MFTRHIKKFNNAAELEAALAAGTIAAPYIALDSSSNVVNMTISAGKEPADIDYDEEQAPSVPVTVGNMFVTYVGQWGYLRAQVNIPLTFNDSTGGTPKVLVVTKSAYDSALANYQDTEAQFIADVFNSDAYERATGAYTTFNTKSIYDSDYPFGTEVTWITERNAGNGGGDAYIEVPTSGSVEYYVLAAQADYATGTVSEDYAFKVATYTLVPGVTDSPAVVWQGIQEYAMDQIATEDNNQKGVWMRVPANSIYDSVRYTGYCDNQYSAEEAITEGTDVREASIGASTNWLVTDNNPFTFVSAESCGGNFGCQYYNSVTGYESGYYGHTYFYVNPS